MALRIGIVAWGRYCCVSLLMMSMILAGCGKNDGKRPENQNVAPVETVDASLSGSAARLTNDQKNALLSGLMPACEGQMEKQDLKAQITSVIRGASLSPEDISIKASRTSGGTKNMVEISIKGEQMSVSCSSESR